MLPSSLRTHRALAAVIVLGTVASLGAAGPRPPLTAAPGSTHVVGIDDGVLGVTTGTTYRFTVDTPEDQGLVATTPTAAELLSELQPAAAWRILDLAGQVKSDATVATGDRVVPVGADAPAARIELRRHAVGGRLEIEPAALTVGTPTDLAIRFTAGQRSGRVTVRLRIPAALGFRPEAATVNIIGRGAVPLSDLPRQSLGRVGSAYSYRRVGEVAMARTADGGTELVLTGLDLRPANGADVELVLAGAMVSATGEHVLGARYTTSEPEELHSPGIGGETATLRVSPTVADFRREPPRGRPHRPAPDAHTAATFRWSPNPAIRGVKLEHSLDGRAWSEAAGAEIDESAGRARIRGLAPGRAHLFRLAVAAGPHAGTSGIARFFAGAQDVRELGVVGDGRTDDTETINAAIAATARDGGVTLRFTPGTYRVRTVHLRSHVWLELDTGATILALKGGDAPETTWFSDRKYRSGLSPTDAGPYDNPENWLTKQDVGHHYFHNSMFFGERIENVKILGTGRISGDGNLVTGDRVMNNAPDNRSDKMFTFKLCRDIEIGGRPRDADLWYDPVTDEPYYVRADTTRDDDLSGMLHIDRGGHFVLLATGTDGISVHDTYFARHHEGDARDIYDFMQCNDVEVTNIYSRVSSDDIVKLGSDCSLGFTRPVRGYRVRNVIGDTNCNLFQIGSETADDIQDVHVDNIYVLGANKAGFSISTNDGAHVRDIHLNCGHTGRLHARSRMLRTHSPFFISVSNRARVLGATVARFKFDEEGRRHDELLATNINIGVVENLLVSQVDVSEQYAGSSHGNAPRWAAYDGKQRKAAPIVAGYRLPDSAQVEDGLGFRLPDGRHTGYIRNVVFRDVHFLAKGGNPASDAARRPPELGVGQYNVGNLGVLPAYGLYARHVAGLTLEDCSFSYEARDRTPALHLEDVTGATLVRIGLVEAADQPVAIQLRDSRDVRVEDVTVHTDTSGQGTRRWEGPRAYSGDSSITFTPAR